VSTSTLNQLLLEAARHLELHNEEYSHRTQQDLIFDLKIKATLLAPTAIEMAVRDCGFRADEMPKVERLLTKLRLM
jgi:hypothetical protein